MDCSLLICLRRRTESAAVVHNVYEATEESWVAMQIDLPVLGLVPFGVEQQVSCVAELLDLLCMELDAIGDCEGVVVRHLVLVHPLRILSVSSCWYKASICHTYLGDLILVVLFDVAGETAEVATIQGRSSTFLAALSKI